MTLVRMAAAACGAEFGLLVGGDAGGHFEEGLVVVGGFGGLASATAADGGVAAGERDARRREAAGEAGAHVGDLVAEEAGDVVELGDVVAVVGCGPEGVASAAEVGPEGGVGVGGLFVLAELLGVDEDDDLGAVDLEVEVLGGGRGRRGGGVVELVDDLLVVGRGGPAGWRRRLWGGWGWICGRGFGRRRLSPRWALRQASSAV